MAIVFGQAVLDHHRGQRETALYVRDGEDRHEHPIEAFYFERFDGDDWLDEWLRGPLLDAGAGAGRHALYYQERFETVAIEVSDSLVTLLDERGVADARHADMFALREQFERDRFGSVLSFGTQLGLAKSRRGLREFLDGLAWVTEDDGTAVVDSYDPTHEDADEMLGYRSDPTLGLAYRVMTFEYGETVGETLLFRLFSPERLREAAADTGWRVADVDRPEDSCHYRAALEKV